MDTGFDEPCPCRHFWDASRRYTAIANEACAGYKITVRRTVRSYRSQEDAERRALELARCEAEAAMASYLRTHAAPAGIEVNYFDNCPPPEPVQIPPPSGLYVVAGDGPGDFVVHWTNPAFMPVGLFLQITVGFNLDVEFTGGETSYSDNATPGIPIHFSLINEGASAGFIDSEPIVTDYENP